MTFEELDQKYPNGFVDAEITALALDYKNRSATFHMNLRGNPPNGKDRDAYQHALLIAREFYYLSIEPPDPDHLFNPKRPMIEVTGYPEDSRKFPLSGHGCSGCEPFRGFGEAERQWAYPESCPQELASQSCFHQSPASLRKP